MVNVETRATPTAFYSQFWFKFEFENRQVPQFILEEAILAGCGADVSVVVTQPRRIAATSVAERVAAERGEPKPGAPGESGRGLRGSSSRVSSANAHLHVPQT
jgi:hypothetical protein